MPNVCVWLGRRARTFYQSRRERSKSEAIRKSLLTRWKRSHTQSRPNTHLWPLWYDRQFILKNGQNEHLLSFRLPFRFGAAIFSLPFRTVGPLACVALAAVRVCVRFSSGFIWIFRIHLYSLRINANPTFFSSSCTRMNREHDFDSLNNGCSFFCAKCMHYTYVFPGKSAEANSETLSMFTERTVRVLT